MIKKVVYSIRYCNSLCPHFYYNYSDNDHIWCDLLNKKIFNVDHFKITDCTPHEIPKDCPLPDADELLGNPLELDGTIINKKVYEVILLGYETSHSFGIFLYYNRAITRWNEIRLEELKRFKEYKDISIKEEPPIFHNTFDDNIWIYEANTPDEHARRRESHPCIDGLYIIEREIDETQ